LTPPRDLRELVGSDIPAEELERLRGVHELVLEAGPPPELPPALAAPPVTQRGIVAHLPRRRRGALALVAAAALAATFGVGYLVGGRSDHFQTAFVPRPMTGNAAAPGAFASLKVGERDDGGNWEILMKVRGLPPLPRDQVYVLWLSEQDKPVALCGSFAVHGGETTVHMSAAYEGRTFDGWVVTRNRVGASGPGKLVMVTRRNAV
jgi:hypothetical protein